VLGPLSEAEAGRRGVDPAWLDQLRRSRRAIAVRLAGEEVTAAVEDAGRLRDALGAALPVGIPDAHLALVADPLGDVVGRYARTHAPFAASDAAHALGLPPAVATEVLDRLAASGRLVRGEFRPLGPDAARHTEYCDPEVLRRIRRRTIARLRHEIEPVPQAQLAAYLPRWQHVAPSGSRPDLRGVDGCFEVIDQLAGTALPASTWMRAVLPARVDDASDAVLDQLIASGDVVWWGLSPLSGGDGVVALAPADRVAALRTPPVVDLDEAQQQVVDVLASSGAVFFRDLADRVGVGASGAVLAADTDLLETLWSLVWSGHVTNDGWAALRARIAGTATRSAPRVRRGRPGLPSRSGPPAGAGRWSLLPTCSSDPTTASTAIAQALLDRHGIVTRGAVAAERIDGGFARMYRVLSAFEDAGRCRRTYAVEGLGASQFAIPVAVDRLRALRPGRDAEIVVLAATDPANAYGAALPWPDLPGTDVAHRPARKAGAVVVLHDGRPALYVEKGGRSMLVWDLGAAALESAARALVRDWARVGGGRSIVVRVNGSAPTPAMTATLTAAGLLATPRGLRLGAR